MVLNYVLMTVIFTGLFLSFPKAHKTSHLIISIDMALTGH